jgi:type II secretory pathway component PulM
MIGQLRNSFLSLPARQQLILLVGGVVLALFLLTELCWRPLAATATRLRASNAESAETLTWMRASAEEVRRLQGRSGDAPAATGPLSQRINQAAQSAGILVNRLQPSGDQEARVWVEDAAWPAAVRWLYALEDGAGIQVRSLSLSETGKEGRINVQALFAE